MNKQFFLRLDVRETGFRVTDPSHTMAASSLVETKVRPPPIREGTIHRPELVERLSRGSRRKLTLLSAPTGFGKTTLLAQWLASEDENRPFAWVNLDAADQDPIRLCAHVVKAIDRIEPGFGDGMRGVLETPGADLKGVVLPRLLNALVSLPRGVVVVFDDYHLLERTGPDNPTAFVLDRLPEAVEFVISTQTESPIPLGRLRASGQLLEIRAPDLAFGEEEAGELLRTALGVELGPEEVKILTRRTEGWPAGLYLAALMLRGSPDHAGDIRSFAGSARFVADYLTEEVLDRQLPEVRRFLIRTSVLRRFSAPLCGAVVGEDDPGELLGWLERSNMFVVPLDGRGEWYRYHQLFADLLRVELENTEPELVPTLHGRAASWHHRFGDVEEALHHAFASGAVREAGELIARSWLTYLNRGQVATLRSWLSQIPDECASGYPPLALVKAWVAAFGGDVDGLERWVGAAEKVGYEGALPDGTSSLGAGVAMIRAGVNFGNARGARAAAQRAAELESDPGSPWHAVSRTVLGYNLYWSGALRESRHMLEEGLRLGRTSPAPRSSTLLSIGFLALADYDLGRIALAAETARRAIDFADENGLGNTTEVGVAHVVRGMVLARDGELFAAEEQMERGIALKRLIGKHNGYAHALLVYAPVRFALGDRDGARALLDEARAMVDGYDDPGERLLSLLGQTERMLRPAARRRAEPGQGLSERELALIPLLGSGLCRQEIADSLGLSVNTVKSHLRSIYRKLGVSSSAEAVERARELALIS